ncbi:MAG: phosphoglycolate phosphatase [Alcaligenaceae bacterium]|nr:phosphoglycolate phosphatase [Alcaligenaceae bacterium]
MNKQINSAITTVLFDLDGTLVDSMPDLAYCSNQTLSDMGRATLSQETLSTFVGKGLDRLIVRFLANDIDAETAEPELFQQAKEIFKGHYHATNGDFSVLYPKVIDALDRLKEMGLKLGLVTNKPMEFTVPLIEKKGILAYFDVLVGGDTCEHKKPHPEPVLYAMAHLQSNPVSTVFVGDSLNDALAAKAAAIPCLMLPYGYNEGQSISKPEPGALVEDLMAVAAWIQAENTKTAARSHSCSKS